MSYAIKIYKDEDGKEVEVCIPAMTLDSTIDPNWPDVIGD
jgi:hypothetical protein